MGGHSAIVLGGGIAGLAATIALDRAGYHVVVIERAPRVESPGAALSIWSNAIAALDMLGVANAILRDATPITSMVVVSRGGRPIMPTMPVSRGVLPTRALLQHGLVNHLGTHTGLRLGTSWSDVTDNGDHATVTLSDGETLRASLIVDASGIHSKVASRLLGTRVTYRGYGGVLAISRSCSSPDTGRAREYWGDGERFGVFDIGHRQRYWFYMRDAAIDDAAPDLKTCRDRAVGWPNEIAEAIGATDPDALIPFAIHARTRPKRLGRGRILCIGDAAHAMEPNLGQGACQSIEDAAVLGRLAARLPPADIVPEFESIRLRRVRSIMRQSTMAGRLVHHAGPIDRLIRGALPLLPTSLHRRQVANAHCFVIPD